MLRSDNELPDREPSDSGYEMNELLIYIHSSIRLIIYEFYYTQQFFM